MTEQTDGAHIVQLDDEPWEPALPLGLPPGVEWRRYEDGSDGITVHVVRFPAGYVEPRHVHQAEHFDVIIEGEMHVQGKILRRGDYLHGYSNQEHGPMAYPVGCTVFAVMRGGSPLHIYDEHL